MLSPQSAATFTEGSGKPIQPTIDYVLPEPERQPELAVHFTEIQLTSPQPEVSTPSGLASAPAREPSQHQVKSAGGPEGPVQPHVSPAGGSKGPVQPSANAGGSVGLVQPSVPPSTPPDPSPSGPCKSSITRLAAAYQHHTVSGNFSGHLWCHRQPPEPPSPLLFVQPASGAVLLWTLVLSAVGSTFGMEASWTLVLLTSGSTSRTILF